MTANERLEKLLNRAGQTISDLPQNHCGLIGRVANLVDIIDRMETALENLLNERDWMIRKMRDIGFCDTCYFNRFSTELTSPQECGDCDPNIWENIMYCYGGVPEDWRADE